MLENKAPQPKMLGRNSGEEMHDQKKSGSVAKLTHPRGGGGNCAEGEHENHHVSTSHPEAQHKGRDYTGSSTFKNFGGNEAKGANQSACTPGERHDSKKGMKVPYKKAPSESGRKA